MSSFIIVSYYTKNTPYEQEVEKLRSSLNTFNIPNIIYAEENLKSWEKNTQLKAKCILRALNEQDKDVVWIDADAIVKQQLTFFENLDCDMSIYYLVTRYNSHEMLSGTIFYKNNDKVKGIVQEWITLNDTNTEWDQRNLQKIVESKTDLNITPLPKEYIHIDRYTKHQGQIPNPAVTHFQASRKFKRIVKR